MHSKIGKIIIIVFMLVSAACPADAELKLESVYPTLGELGKDLQVTLTGTGFDADTRVSMCPYPVNKTNIIGSVKTPGAAYGVAVAGDTAFVAGWGSGLQVIDISTRYQPKISRCAKVF